MFEESLRARLAVLAVGLMLSLGGLTLAQSGGDGSSIEQAIVITGAANTFEGIAKESEWIRQNLPGWRKVGQALLQAGGPTLRPHQPGRTKRCDQDDLFRYHQLFRQALKVAQVTARFTPSSEPAAG